MLYLRGQKGWKESARKRSLELSISDNVVI